MKNIKFVKNDLGNTMVLSEDNQELEGFIKHIELFKNTPEIIHLNITEEEYNDTNNIYIYIRHKKSVKIEPLIKQIKEVFQQKNLVYETELYKDKTIVVDLFFYK